MIDYKDRLAWAMKQAQVDATTLAKKLGVTYQAIKKIEAGTSKSLSAKNHELVAAALKVSGYWLATGKGPRVPPHQGGANAGWLDAPHEHPVDSTQEVDARCGVGGTPNAGWPFAHVTQQQWNGLDQSDREKLEAQVLAVFAYTENAKKVGPM